MQQIEIEGLEVESLIGVYDFERTAPTKLLVDVLVHADVERAMHSDNVADTIDYAALANTLYDVAKEASFELLEALGYAMMQQVLSDYPRVQRVRLAIAKPGILPNADKVRVILELAR